MCLAALFVLPFTGCSKDDDDNDSLVGTAWTTREERTGTEDGVTYHALTTATLRFKTKKDISLDSKVTFTVDGVTAGSYSDIQRGTYTYDDKKGTLTIFYEDEDDDEEEQTLYFTISGNKLTITDEEESVVFTKQ